jgi:hypothetical protein
MDILQSFVGLYSGASVSRFLAFVAPALVGVALKVPKAAHAELRAPSRDTFHQPTRPLDPSLHWARVAAVVDGAAESASRVRDMQAGALARVEMAEYALGRLIVDVAEVMPAASNNAHAAGSTPSRPAPRSPTA